MSMSKSRLDPTVNLEKKGKFNRYNSPEVRGDSISKISFRFLLVCGIVVSDSYLDFTDVQHSD